MYANFYGTKELDPQNLANNLPIINNAGFNSVTLGLFHVGRDIHNSRTDQDLGDIVYGDTVAITLDDQGVPVFENQYGLPWKNTITELRNGGIEKIYFSFGGGQPVVDFTTLKDNFIQNGEIIPGSTFYKNFMALGAMYADVIDGIDIDDEDSIETDVIVAFGKLVLEAGFKEVTFCPPFANEKQGIDVWVNAAIALDNVKAGAVTLFNLQAYGSAVPSQTWVDEISNAGLSVPPSITGGFNAQYSSPETICSSTDTWRHLDGYVGSFIWNYHQMILKNSTSITEYATAIKNGMDGNCSAPTTDTSLSFLQKIKLWLLKLWSFFFGNRNKQ